MNFFATSPAFIGSHLAKPKQDSGAFRNTLKRYVGSSIDKRGIESRQLKTFLQAP